MINRAMLTLGLSALSLLCCVGRSEAQFFTGNAFYEQCREARTPLCTGYIIGLSDSTLMYEEVMQKKNYCPVGGLTGTQLLDVVIAYMKENPATRQYVATSIAAWRWPKPIPARRGSRRS